MLDIGAWDGWFTFEMERRGATVVAIDCWDNPRFHEMRRLLNSQVEYRLMDVYDVTPETVGRFDIVLFMGVLYHLKHPLLALERVCAVTTDMAAVDSFILREEYLPGQGVEHRAVMEFYETDEFGGQTDNWCGPSLPCLMAFCRTAGFARVEYRATLEHSGCLACYRKWLPGEDAVGAELIDVFHHTSFGINFDTRRDEYVAALFRSGEKPATVEPRVSEYGVRPISCRMTSPGIWQANFLLPPGLEAGWHDVTVRVDGALSNARRIAVDVRLKASELRIARVEDGTRWIAGVLDRSSGDVLSAWVDGLAENADRSNLRATLSGFPVEVLYVSPSDGQVNLKIPQDAPPGFHRLEVTLAGVRSQAFPVEINSAS